MEKSAGITKVLFVITKSSFGGAQHYVYDLATTLPREQFEVVVALGGQGLLVHKLRFAGVRTVSLPSLERNVSPLRDAASFFTLWRIFCTERPDVVHLNSAKASGLGALAARLAGVPNIIFTAHGWAFNEDRSRLSRMVIKFLSWMTVVLAHKTIAVSKAVYRDTQNWPFINNKVVTIHNGVNEVAFLSREKAHEKLFQEKGFSIPHGALIVGTIAELHPNKGLPYAIEAIARLSVEHPDIYYVILGDGEEKGRLNALVEAHGLHGRVLLLGFVKDASHYLKAFACFLLPSVKEGLPYVLLEAGLAGLPVIASRVGGIPEVVEDKKTGFLVPPRDPEAIAYATKDLFDSPALRAKLGAALREKVIRDFSFDRVISETIGVYEGK
jgi:glycosyltransferase involved in cell wall biosynthesis